VTSNTEPKVLVPSPTVGPSATRCSVLTKGHEYLSQMGFELNEKTRNGVVPGTCENIYKNIH
jgi:hypothetical protein